MKGWKTVALGVALCLLAIAGNQDVQGFVHAHLPACEGGLGVAVVALRAVTSSAIFKAGT